jgi:hypothetical protein
VVEPGTAGGDDDEEDSDDDDGDDDDDNEDEEEDDDEEEVFTFPKRNPKLGLEALLGQFNVAAESNSTKFSRCACPDTVCNIHRERIQFVNSIMFVISSTTVFTKSIRTLLQYQKLNLSPISISQKLCLPSSSAIAKCTVRGTN